ncbi:MAG: TrpB-like pyridoxal phosphate-dependent enzyme [Bacteroidales bacterium]|jgi:tryptophan synthase beta chain|nr:TrpB-like pyridoxal phosphate-dependent enzyme [Bacteroidales bacterium]
MKKRKYYLSENEIPEFYYNIQADMPKMMQPPLHPATLQPIAPVDLEPLFPMELIKQEVSLERYIPVPDEVHHLYSIYRPSPLIRATELERALDTPAHIYYKYEGVSPSGSHKTNTAIAQAYYNKAEGVKKIVTETGAGQWGSALSFACNHFGLQLQVFMVKVSYFQKPYRKTYMNAMNASVVPSPSTLTVSGKKVLTDNPESPGSLGIAISEAVEIAAQNEDTRYSLGSVLNHVLLHQTIIGLEAIRQMEMAGEMPDLVIGCFGGGSNFAGLAFPFLRLNLKAGGKMRFIAVEPESCPKLTRGTFRYDFGDTAGLTPLIPMYTLGHQFVPPEIHAGGLRYHGAGAIISQLLQDKLIEATAVGQSRSFDAGLLFARTEGIIPAPESSHAIATVVAEALKAREEGISRTILFNLSGHGHYDMGAFERFLKNELPDYSISDEEIAKSLAMSEVPVN